MNFSRSALHPVYPVFPLCYELCPMAPWVMYSIKLLLLKEQSCSTPGDAERSNWTFARKPLTYSMTPLGSDWAPNAMACTVLRFALAWIMNMWKASNPSWETTGTLGLNDSHFLPSPSTQEYIMYWAGSRCKWAETNTCFTPKLAHICVFLITRKNAQNRL